MVTWKPGFWPVILISSRNFAPESAGVLAFFMLTDGEVIRPQVLDGIRRRLQTIAVPGAPSALNGGAPAASISARRRHHRAGRRRKP